MERDALDAIRAQLPAWIGLAPLLIWAPAAWLTARWTTDLATRIAIGPYRKRPPESHWTERARLAWPARVATTFFAMLTTSLLGGLSVRAGGELALLPHAVVVPVVALCAWLGAATARIRLHRELSVGTSRAGELGRDDAVQLLLLSPHVLLPLVFAPAVRVPLDGWDAAVVAALALLLACLAVGGALRILGWMRLTEPAPDRLLGAVGEAARALGVAAPPVTVVRWGVANAFAFPIGGQLAFSTRALEVLDEAGLAAVAGHEIGHLTEPLGIRWLRCAMLFALLPLVGLVAAWQLAGPIGVLAPVAGMLVLAIAFRAVAARMEKRADEVAHGAGEPAQYAGALARIYEANLVPAVLSEKQIHPHLYDRVLAAGATPDYPRPAPPSAPRLRAAILVPLLWLVPATTALAGLPILLTVPALHDRAASDLVIALEPGSEPLLRRALFEEAHGDTDGVLAFAQAAAALAPYRHEPPALAAMALGRQGRCNEAEATLLESEALALDGADDAWVLTARHWLDTCRSEARSASASAR